MKWSTPQRACNELLSSCKDTMALRFSCRTVRRVLPVQAVQTALGWQYAAAWRRRAHVSLWQTWMKQQCQPPWMPCEQLQVAMLMSTLCRQG